jgi:nucleotide-binding universal stress UspA family protein
MLQSPLRSVLVATDLGAGSDEVVQSAAALAAAAGAELHVVHALDIETAVAGREAIRSLADWMEQAQLTVDDQVRRVVPRGTKMHTRIVDGMAHGAIIEEAKSVSADLIVLGPHRGGDAGAHFLGTTADRVLRTSEVPCLVVKDPLTLPLRQIGVPIDFSEPARGALETAVRWSPLLGTTSQAGESTRPEIHAFHVGWTVDLSDNPSLPQKVFLPRLDQEVKDLRQRSGMGSEVAIRKDVVWGVSPALEISNYAREHNLDLLVIGTHGHGGVKRLLIGSVASGVARHAPCPVLLIPPAFSRGAETSRSASEARARLGRVLVAVDFSESSVAAARWSVRHFAPDAEHRFVHVLDLAEPPAFLGGPTAAREEELRRAPEIADSRLRALARELIGDEPVTVREGKPVREISRAAAELDADVVVVGEHGRKGLQGWVGSTAEGLAGSSPAPVLLTRALPSGPPGRILAAVDESNRSMEVLVWARVLSERFHSPLHVVYSLDVVRYGFPQGPGQPLPAADPAEETAALEWLRELTREAGLAGDKIRIQVTEGEPGAAIVATAIRDRTDLIVMGSRGAGSVGRVLLGSVSRSVLRQAPCSVFVVGDPARSPATGWEG